PGPGGPGVPAPPAPPAPPGGGPPGDGPGGGGAGDMPPDHDPIPFGGGMGPGGTWRYINAQIVRHEQPISGRSGTWLAYTRYDGIVLTKDDLDELHRASTTQSVKDIVQALWRYVEAGGTLLVMSPDPAPPKKGVKPGKKDENQRIRSKPVSVDVPEAW